MGSYRVTSGWHMFRVIIASATAALLLVQAYGLASAFERSLGNLHDDYVVMERSLGNMAAPVGPGIDARLLEFTPPEYLSPAPASPFRNACMAGCTYCRDGCTWHWRTNCYGEHCEPQFAMCMASCWQRSCQACRSHPSDPLYSGVDVFAKDEEMGFPEPEFIK